MENSATLVFSQCSMTYMYALTIRSSSSSFKVQGRTPVVVYGPKHVWNWLHEKKGLSCARPRKSGMHIKTSHKFFCHNSNRDTNLASNFLSEETAWRNIIVFARAKNVGTRLILPLFVKISLKLFGPANFDSVRWNIALHQTECPVKYFCLREVCWIWKVHMQHKLPQDTVYIQICT